MSKQSYALLADGQTVQISPVHPDDAEAVRQLHERMSAQSLYLRFFGMSRRLAATIAERICLDPVIARQAVVARQAGTVVGVAHYEKPDAAGVAEVAIVVADGIHGKGVGTLLVEYLASRARTAGVRAFRAEALAHNHAVLRMFADAGLAATVTHDSTNVTLTIPLVVDDAYLDAVAERERRADVESLRPLLRPGVVAIVGASRRAGSVGQAITRNAAAGGFTGRLYAVNPHATEIAGTACYPSVDALPEVPDLALIAVPAAAVCDVARDCGRRGVRALVVITAGFDQQSGAQLLSICRQYGMRLVGPNCFGVADNTTGLNATFARRPIGGLATVGGVGIAVQSGGVGIALLEHLARLDVGVSSFVSLGDKYDVSSNDLMRWWQSDGTTRLGILYLESFGNARKFSRLARRLGRTMPIVTVLAGQSEVGQRAAASHTAATATPAVTREALFGQAGVITTRTLGELLDTVALLTHQPLPAGPRVGIVSNAGGAGVLAADACVAAGLTVEALAEPTRARLAALLPAGAACAGPVDTTAAVDADTFGACVSVLAEADEVDAVLAISAPTALSDPSAAVRGVDTTPVLGVAIDQAEAVRLRGDVPFYADAEGAARALARAWSYARWRARPAGVEPAVEVAVARAAAIIGRAVSPAGQAGDGWLSAVDTMELLTAYGLPMAPWRWATSEDEAVSAAAALAGPVALKADADGVVHKSEAGAVALGLTDADAVRQAYRGMAARLGPLMRGVLVQAMAADGVEVLAGVVQEPVFGPLVVFGLGGVATDILADRAARLAPLTDLDAAELVRAPRGAALLRAYRGRPAVDLAGLEDVVIRLSRLASDHPEIAEIDLNPVIARPDGVVAVDGRVRVQLREPVDPYLRTLR